LDANKNESLIRLKNLIDKANGYVFNSMEEKSVNTMLGYAFSAENDAEKSKNDYDQYMS
jgi:hypothetical protein